MIMSLRHDFLLGFLIVRVSFPVEETGCKFYNIEGLRRIIIICQTRKKN